ncbi:anti-sigma factor [Mesorhizobium sp. RP14(2022)]|uniref:Anti-sigma factor n=1 Tax=Mesorhizobium liriopis TaxID=2953882 RepID=A0ABT1C2Y6_9HYPH|nr:anti-sigma factor [Mesorhizobium liriopis]MCO6049189.1 anti-sigma factor [Mesorhizobium liriopis]
MSASRDDRVADYVLGLMEAAEAEAFERELAQDADLARIVAESAAQFHELDATAEPRPPRDEIWRGIESRLGTQRPPVAVVRPEWAAIWQSLRFWRWTGFGGLATSAALAAALVAFVARPAPAPQFVAVLVPADSTAPGAIVEIDAQGAARLITLKDIPVPEGRALEVWTLPSVERGPVSIGLMPRAQSRGLSLTAVPPTHSDQLFEITLEPASGSPIGRPTGPVLYKGLTVQAL